MATAVKNNPDATTTSLFDRPAAISLAGVVYVVGSLGIVFKLLPYLIWDVLGHVLYGDRGFNTESAGNNVVVAMVLVAAATGLLILGLTLLGPRSAHGTRAGIFVGVVGFVLILLIARWASLWIEYWAYYEHWFSPAIGAVLTAIFGFGLLVAGGYFFLQPGFEPFLQKLEDQGWFSATTFKSQQGQRVRRGTILGILLIVGAGIYTMINHGTLRRMPKNWELNVPFTAKTEVDLSQYDSDDFRLKKLRETFKITPPADAESVAPHGLRATPVAMKPQVATWYMGQGLTSSVAHFPNRRLQKKVDDSRRKSLSLNNAFANHVVRPDKSGPEIVYLNRYALRDFNADVVAKYVKIDDVGSSALTPDAIVEKSEFNEVVKEAKSSGSTEPKAIPLDPISGTDIYATVQLLPSIMYTLPILLLAVSLWGAWRIVNYPTFADFLIATEAELNKVSWTTRKKLVQDTIVVLVTVFLMAVYLFAMDMAWSHLLEWQPIRIIQIPKENKDSNKSVESRPW